MYKNNPYDTLQGITKTSVLMKGTVVLIIMICFCVCIKANAQTVTLTGKNLDIEKVFREIRKQTGYNFIYNVAWLHEMKPVSLALDHVTLTDALDKTFVDEPFTYTIIDKTIALKEKPVAQKKNEDLNTPKTISGHVSDSAGTALVGASVLVKGSANGTTTDAKGRFILQNIEEPATLKISYTGYDEKDYKIAGNTENNISIALTRSNNKLDEIQVIAYGKISKRLNTGDQTTVTSKEIEQQPVLDPMLALEGLVPGMLISQNNGLPGSAVQVQIRGRNSIANGSDPFYVVDGVPYISANLPSNLSNILGNFSSGSPLSYINPADIESINVLKDADATSIYGTRGANGVVLITTKKGKAGQTRVDFNLQDGWGKVADKLKLLSTPQYLAMRHEAFNNDGSAPNPKADYDLTLWDTTRQTDWQKELIGGTAKYTDAEATVSGGNANTQFLIGAGYNRQTTVFPGSQYNQRGSVNFNINNTSPNQKFNIQLSGIYSLNDNHLSGYDLTQQALQLAPDAPPMYNADGTLNYAHNAAGVSTWPNYNPAAMLIPKYQSQAQNLISNLMLVYHIIKGLDIKSSFGYTNTQTNEVQTNPLSFWDPAVRPYEQRRSSFVNNNIHSWIIEPQVSYSGKISNGSLNMLLGATFQQNTGNGQSLSATGFNSDLQLEDIMAATTITATGATNVVYKYNALFARVNYNWEDKYILNVTFNRDGSSRFGPQNQFNNFAAAGAAWIFTKEDFVKSTLPFLSFGKLRASYGSTGSDQIGDYSFMDLYQPLPNIGVPYQQAIGFYPSSIFTPDLSWEETKKLEAALELGFLEDRIYFSAALYQSRSSNQILGYQLPAIAGFTYVNKNLDAVVQNEGIELVLNTVNITSKNFRWTSSLNFTSNRNELLSVAADLSKFYQGRVGHPLSSMYVYHSLGVDPFTGQYIFQGSQGSTSNPDPLKDKTVLININPKFFGGLQNSFNYKGIQLDFLFQFSVGSRASNYDYATVPGTFTGSFGGNQPLDVLNRWQQPGDVKPFQKFSQNGSVGQAWQNLQQSDGVYSDNSFIRLRNVSLSWQLPATWLRKMQIKNAGLFIHAQNLLTITGYKGLDPETGLGTLPALPPLKVITVGVRLTL